MTKKVKKLDQFIIYLSQPLGVGSYGTVYLAEDTSNHNIKRAIKIIPKAKIIDAYLMAAFRTELILMCKVKSEGVVKFYNIIETLNNFYLVLQYCEGGDLRHFMRGFPKGLPVKQALSYCKNILKSFQILPQKGVTHRDLKPENILIQGDKLKICDFGFAKASESNYLSSFVGSPGYMSPQILNREKYTFKCDVWAFGIIAHELLYGVRPIPSQITSIVEIRKWLQSHQEFTFNPLDCEQQLASNILFFLNKCLQKTEQKRFSWQDIYNHPLFKQKDCNVENLKLRYIMSTLRVSIHMENIDMNRFFQKYQKQPLNEYAFLLIINLLSEEITLEDVRYLMSLYGRKNPQTNELSIYMSDLRNIFKQSGIKMESMSYSQVVALQNTLCKHILSQISTNQTEQKVKQSKILRRQEKQVLIEDIKKSITKNPTRFRKIYEHLDKQKQNKINKYELYEALKELDDNISEESSNKIFDIFSNEEKGQISCQQFYRNLCKIVGEPIRQIHS